MGNKKILSIDWDYFCDATIEEIMRLFPDGGNENLPLFLSNIIWASRYSSSTLMQDEKGLENIEIKKQEFELVKKILEKVCQNDIDIVIAESHAGMYDFTKTFKGNVDVYNIDFHHDMFDNDSKCVNCGNWLKKLIDGKKVEKAFWVKGDNSDMNIPKGLNVLGSVKDLENIDFDGVFICKSSVWSPPHLDKYFLELLELLEDCYDFNMFIDSDIFIDRYEEIKDKIEEDMKTMKKFINKNDGDDSIKQKLKDMSNKLREDLI